MSVKKARTGSLIVLTFQERVRANPLNPITGTFSGFAPRSCYEEEISILFLPNWFSIFRKLLSF